jgi:hypothetical protein
MRLRRAPCGAFEVKGIEGQRPGHDVLMCCFDAARRIIIRDMAFILGIY